MKRYLIVFVLDGKPFVLSFRADMLSLVKLSDTQLAEFNDLIVGGTLSIKQGAEIIIRVA